MNKGLLDKMDKNYKGNMISMKLSDDIDGLTITLSKFNKLLAQNLKKHFVDKKDSFSKKMIQEMNRIIKRGGSEVAKYAWTYWIRRKGKKNWRSVKPTTSKRSFSWGVTRYSSRKEIMYPVHPSTYWGNKYYSRGARRSPERGQYAMTDYGSLRSSITSFANLDDKSMTVKFYSTGDRGNEKILNNEKGWTVKGSGKVQRPIIQPAVEKVKPLVEKYMNQSMKDTDKDVNKLFQSLKRVKK
jgi:hypothetical protein